LTDQKFDQSKTSTPTRAELRLEDVLDRFHHHDGGGGGLGPGHRGEIFHESSFGARNTATKNRVPRIIALAAYSLKEDYQDRKTACAGIPAANEEEAAHARQRRTSRLKTRMLMRHAPVVDTGET